MRALSAGNFEGIGTVAMKDYQQTDTGRAVCRAQRHAAQSVSIGWLSAGIAQVDGYLNIDIDEVSPGVPFVPALGQTV